MIAAATDRFQIQSRIYLRARLALKTKNYFRFDFVFLSLLTHSVRFELGGLTRLLRVACYVLFFI